MSAKVDILGVKFDETTEKEMLATLYERLHTGAKTFIVTANPEIVMYAQDDASYRELINQADYVVPDGIGVVYASRYQREALPERVPGFDLMLGLLEIANRTRKRVYLLGGTEAVIEKTVACVAQNYPDLIIAGYHHGYIDPADPTYREGVKATSPDIVLVAMGFPRQEQWAHQYLAEVESGIAMGVGGSFDVLAGAAKRAPDWIQRLNIEWLYRLMRQPSRWGRMLAIPKFMWKIIRSNKGRNT